MAMRVSYTVANGRVLSENRNAVKRDYLSDSLGSTVALLDNTQAKTDTFAYWPYGEVKTRTGTTATPFQFVGTMGYFRDTDSRVYVRARSLRTAHGRWLNQDPIGLASGWNLYIYVGNEPVSNADFTGLFAGITCNSKYAIDSVSCDSDLVMNKCGGWSGSGGGTERDCFIMKVGKTKACCNGEFAWANVNGFGKDCPKRCKRWNRNESTAFVGYDCKPAGPPKFGNRCQKPAKL